MLKNLKSIRRETNLSQKQVAEKLNISQQTYSDYENCKTEPSSDTLTEIAKLFDVSVDELLGREDFTPEERAAGAMATRKESITPLEDELLYVFRRLGKKHGEEIQRSIITMIEKMG